MMQRVLIKNFGPIQSVDLEIKKFSLFFGPQASGKSTISKSIYFFKSIRDDLYELVINHLQFDKKKINVSTLNKMVTSKFIHLFGTTHHLDEFYLEYSYTQKHSITVKKGEKYIFMQMSNSLHEAVREIISEVRLYKENKTKEINSRSGIDNMLKLYEDRAFIKLIQERIFSVFGDDRELLFIPAGRSLIATLSNKLNMFFKIQEFDRNVDYLTRQFSEKIINTRDVFDKSLNDLVEERKALSNSKIPKSQVDHAIENINEILKGSYRYEDGRDKFYINNYKYVPLNFASSGQQESIWILYLIFLFILEGKDCFVVIEEPEAHLFPRAQKYMLYMISLLANFRNNQCIVTTHSPYILSTMNNLIYSGYLGVEKGYEDDVRKIIDKNYWMDYNNLNSLYIHGGVSKEIFDPETKLLDPNLIDSVSNENNEDFERLYELED